MAELRRLWAGENRSHTLVLCICLALLSAGLVLSPPTQEGQRLSLFGFALPPLCSFRVATGMNCPGCGLTRSVTATAHGDLESAWHWNPVGPLVVLYTLLQLVRRLCFLYGHRWWQHHEPSWGKVLDHAVIILPVLMALQWILKLTR